MLIKYAYCCEQIEAWYVVSESCVVPHAHATYDSYFSGYVNKDIAFYHKASKTVIAADLLFNIPGTEQVCRPSNLHFWFS